MMPRKATEVRHRSQEDNAPNEAAPAAASCADQQAATDSEAALKLSLNELAESSTEAKSSVEKRKRSSWYGGTWPQVYKASPVTQVARESISAALPEKLEKGKAATVASTPSPSRSRDASSPARSPSLSLRHRIASSSRAAPLAATTTKLNISSDGTAESSETSIQEFSKAPEEQGKSIGQAASKVEENDKKSIKDTSQEQQVSGEADDKATLSSSGWMSWISKSSPAVLARPNSNQVPTATLSPVNSKDLASDEGNIKKSDEPSDGERKTTENNRTSSTQRQSQSLLSYWTGRAEPQNGNDPINPESAARQPDVLQDNPAPPAEGANEPAAVAKSSGINQAPLASKPSAWAFWSRDTSRSRSSQVGELAVADSSAQPQPEDAETKPPPTVSKTKPVPESKQQIQASKDKRDESLPASNQKGTSIQATLEPIPDSLDKSLIEAASKLPASKSSPSNLVLPSFESTYKFPESPSYLQQLARRIYHGNNPPAKHVDLLKTPPRIKKATAIGIHGYFPAPLVRTLLGQPTGTSLRFADSAADAIQDWTRRQGYSCEVYKVALEGEGKIFERVDMLWKLLLSWIDQIRQSDLVLVACHSQGVPVALMLVAKLVEFGCINSARVGVCAMAGVNLGPFPDFKSRLFSGSAGELFEFSNSQSVVSKKYEAAVRVAVSHGVRILYAGSIDDQLVPLESSTFSNISHPYLYRAVFVDGRVHAPDFITHLVGFALKLRNLGISDHGLIRELSSPLAGSLYSGEGHSRLYEDRKVYYLAIEHAMRTTSVGNVPLQVQPYEAPANNNPFILPWAMRGVLEEEYVRTTLNSETAELLAQFDKWRPVSKVLKDVKFRLEAVRSKL